MCNLLCGGKTRVCRKQGGSQALRSQSLSSIKYCTLKYPLTSSPRNFVSWVWFCQTHRLTPSGSTDVKTSFMIMKKHFVLKSETCVWILIYISAEDLPIKDFGCLGELIYLQNWEIGASIWGTFPPLAFSFCTWVGGTGLWDWPVARYMAWTHRIRSCSSSLAKITVSPSFTALKNVLPPSKPGSKGSDNAVSQTLRPARRSLLVSHPTTAQVSPYPVPCCSQLSPLPAPNWPATQPAGPQVTHY